VSKKFDFDFNSFTFEELKEMSTDTLRLNIIKFKRMIKEARASGVDTTPFEVEFCYLDNEKQMRMKYERQRGGSSR
jgi:hypothetical protein